MSGRIEASGFAYNSKQVRSLVPHEFRFPEEKTRSYSSKPPDAYRSNYPSDSVNFSRVSIEVPADQAGYRIMQNRGGTASYRAYKPCQTAINPENPVIPERTSKTGLITPYSTLNLSRSTGSLPLEHTWSTPGATSPLRTADLSYPVKPAFSSTAPLSRPSSSSSSSPLSASLSRPMSTYSATFASSSRPRSSPPSSSQNVHVPLKVPFIYQGQPKQQHPLYKTTTNEYGQEAHQVANGSGPMTYKHHPLTNYFSKTFIKGPSKTFSLNTKVESSTGPAVEGLSYL